MNGKSGSALREKMEFFDRLAPEWRRNNRLTLRDRELLLSSLLPGELDRSGPVLDLGGGPGRLAGLLPRSPASPLVVFDLSHRMLAESPVPGRRIQGDAHRLPFRDRTIGLIFCFCAFPHFEGQEEVIRECARTLRPGGGLIILHGCSREEINRFHSARDPVIAGDHLPPLEYFRRWGESAGMIPERLEDGRERFLVRYRKPVF